MTPPKKTCQPKKLAITDAKFICYDFETIVCDGIHVSNYVVVETACSGCMERAVEAKCIGYGTLCYRDGCDGCRF